MGASVTEDWDTPDGLPLIVHYDGSGTCADSSVGYRLASGAVRSPDASWVRNDRLATFSAKAKE